MRKATALSILFFSIFSALWLNGAVPETPEEVETWYKSLSPAKQPDKMTKLHLYIHEFLKGKHQTASYVAQSNLSASSPTLFGKFIIADDPFTVGLGFGSKRVGYLKGFYGGASFEEIGLIMVMTFVFTDEVYNGSSLSILGYFPGQDYDESPIVGGTGRFRLARGSVWLRNYYYNPVSGNTIIEVKFAVLHY